MARRRRSRTRSISGRYVIIAVAAILVAAIAGFAYAYFTPSTPSATTTRTTTTGSGSNANLIYAKINTSMGTIEVELYPDSAPKTVANFVNLAKSGFYNNLVWHRIVQGFVIQTGDPNTKNGGGDRSTWGTGGSSSTVPLEIDRSLHNNLGYLGMARAQDPNSGSSQFYINLSNNNSLDGQYTVFGKVISGMDVVTAIGNVPVNSAQQPTNNVVVTSITIQSSP